MTPSEREAARKRCEAATAGPWARGDTFVVWAELGGSNLPMVADCRIPSQMNLPWPVRPLTSIDGGSHEANSLFVLHARTDLPAALDQIDSDERLMEQVLESHDHFPHGVGAATDALRARLGEESDDERE